MALVAFDFDGALSTTDLSVLLGREYDREHEIQGLADQARRGEVDVTASIRQRVSLLEGMPEARVTRAFERAKLRAGADALLTDLRRSGAIVAIITGSFESGVRTVLDRADVAVDHLVANRLVVANEALTGAVEGPLVDGRKDSALEEVAEAAGVGLGRTIAVGDDATDLPMLRAAGSAVGFEPEPLVEEACDEVVTSIRALRLYFEQHDVIAAEPG